MQIQMEVTQKMKLYNVYRLCKKYIESLSLAEFKQSKESMTYVVDNWLEQNSIFNTLEKIPVLHDYAYDCITEIPQTVRHMNEFNINSQTYNEYRRKTNILRSKMNDIIELYESLNLENEGNGIDIKIPPCDNLKEYISYLKDIEFVFSQCPFLQCEGEILKFGSVDVGSSWIKLTLAATVSTCMILTNAAALVDKALVLRAHYIAVQQQEELLKSMQIKNELAEEQVDFFKQLKTAGMSAVIQQLENDIFKLGNPEDRDRAERTLEKIILLFDKGCEFYATLDSPDDVQSLFPEIQGNLELPNSLMKYLEDKETSE